MVKKETKLIITLGLVGAGIWILMRNQTPQQPQQAETSKEQSGDGVLSDLIASTRDTFDSVSSSIKGFLDEKVRVTSETDIARLSELKTIVVTKIQETASSISSFLQDARVRQEEENKTQIEKVKSWFSNLF